PEWANEGQGPRASLVRRRRSRSSGPERGSPRCTATWWRGVVGRSKGGSFGGGSGFEDASTRCPQGTGPGCVLGAYASRRSFVMDSSTKMASGDRILPVSARASLVDQAWVVRRYTLREALGRPYRLEAELRATRSEPWFGADDLVGQEIELVVERGDEERVVTGVVRKVTALPDDGHRQRVRVTAVPAMGLADRARRRRIFQDRAVVEIVTVVFQELFERFGRGLAASRLVNVYPRRDYRVQYDEDDLAFAH